MSDLVFKDLWKITLQLKRGRKVHLAGSDEFGKPLLFTVCGKRYHPDQRIRAKKGRDLEGHECSACVTATENWVWDQVKEWS